MTNTIKVITIYQPWATLLAHGIKQIETRPKPTTHKGLYLIHAAKKWTPAQIAICSKEPFYHSLQLIGLEKKPWDIMFPLGCIVGSFYVDECFKIKQDLGIDNVLGKIPIIASNGNLIISFDEYSYGNFGLDRFAWIGIKHKVLKKPIPYKGGQGYYRNFNGDLNLIKELL